MSSIGTGYDLSVTTCSPDGRVFQIEYSTKAVDNSGVYGEPIPVKELAERVASYVHPCTLYWWLRGTLVPQFGRESKRQKPSTRYMMRQRASPLNWKMSWVCDESKKHEKVPDALLGKRLAQLPTVGFGSNHIAACARWLVPLPCHGKKGGRRQLIVHHGNVGQLPLLYRSVSATYFNHYQIALGT